MKLFSSLFLVFMLVSVKAWSAVCLADQAGSAPSSLQAPVMQLSLLNAGHEADAQGADHKTGFDCLTACVSDAALNLSIDESGIESQRAPPVVLAAFLPIVHARAPSRRASFAQRHRDFPRQDILLRTQRTRC